MIYADYNATTPLLPEVYEAMIPFLQGEFANPSHGLYPLSKRAAQAVEEARAHVAALIDAPVNQVVFVSGGTESCASALIGAVLGGLRCNSIVTSKLEHSAVLETVNLLAAAPFNCNIAHVGPTPSGALNLAELEDRLSSEVGLASFMLANNETGVIWPIERVAEICRNGDIPLHCDAVQAVGKIPVSFSKLGVGMMSVSAHKFGGPKGVGALVMRGDVPWKPLFKGGGQELERRGGTPAVAAIVGFGCAAALATARLASGADGLSRLRNLFESLVTEELSGVRVFGQSEPRLPNTTSLCFGNVVAKQVVERLGNSEAMVSAGSACHSTSVKPSHVLVAMGATTVDALSTVRVSFGPQTTEGEVRHLVEVLCEVVSELRRRDADVVSLQMSLQHQ